VRTVEALRGLGVAWRTASPFVLLDGRLAARQLSLF